MLFASKARTLDQELRNAVYSGPFATDAKRHFSKPGCPAQKIASSYLEGPPHPAGLP